MYTQDSMIDVIIPVYNEGSCIFDNITCINSVLLKTNIKHRFILIDDGSKDITWLEIKRLKERLGNVLGLRLSRNFGKESALSAGLSEVTAEFALVMDSDLQHPPEMVAAMIQKINEGVDIVECIKENRGKETLMYKLSAKLFYKAINKLSGFEMDNSSDFKLFNTKVINAWREIKDTHVFFRGIMQWVGFEKAQIGFTVAERKGGESKFSTKGLIKFAINALTSFTASPLYLTNILAAVFFIGAIILGIQTLYNKIIGIADTGFSTVILLLLIIGSGILFCLGIIGTYISKIYDEVKGRPRFLLKDRLD